MICRLAQHLNISNWAFQIKSMVLRPRLLKGWSPQKKSSGYQPAFFTSPQKPCLECCNQKKKNCFVPICLSGTPGLLISRARHCITLTTQVAKDIKVASKVKEIRTQIGNINIRRVKSYIDVTDDNYNLLEFLDALKDFKLIPDLNKRTAVKQLTATIESLKKKKICPFSLQGSDWPHYFFWEKQCCKNCPEHW